MRTDIATAVLYERGKTWEIEWIGAAGIERSGVSYRTRDEAEAMAWRCGALDVERGHK